MFLIFLLIFGGQCHGLTMDDLNGRLLSLENKVGFLESEIRALKSKNEDLESKIEIKEVEADVSYLMMEQGKIQDRIENLENNSEPHFGMVSKEFGSNLGSVNIFTG